MQKKECKHPTCENFCRRPKKEKKHYQLKRTPLKKRSIKISTNNNLLPLSELLKLAQLVFNKYIRNRDNGCSCISSGNKVEQAGHYYAAGSFSGVRFDEINVNGQSVEDNCFKSGNASGYREGLIKKYGLQVVQELDQLAKDSKFKKWSREELEHIIKKYKI